MATFGLGDIAASEGDLRRSQALYEESLAHVLELGNKEAMAALLGRLGEIARLTGDYAQATARNHESLALFREMGHKEGIAIALYNLGQVMLQQGDSIQAAAYFMESLALYWKLGATLDIADSLAGMAGVACAQGQPEQAARLFGAAAVLQDATGAVMLPGPVPIFPADRLTYDWSVAAVRSQLDAATFDAAWSAGCALTLEQAMAEALEIAQLAQSAPKPPPPSREPTYPAGLTEREVDVLRLVAQGLTNAQVAERLIISPRTVNAHLNAIYRKLDVSSRSAATRFAVEHDLV
jgi:DNA-binding CsgD family transcriptional regulator